MIRDAVADDDGVQSWQVIDTDSKRLAEPHPERWPKARVREQRVTVELE
jgi:hypothetical protein